jgi:Family of unknown function (DUF5677)
MLLVGFAARGRRLLRSAYRLIDADERDTAGPLVRVLNEYVIVSRWLLQASAEEVLVWAIDDLHRRMTVFHDVLADPKVHSSVKESVERERDHTEAAIAEYSQQLPPAAGTGRPRPPSLEVMARFGAAVGFIGGVIGLFILACFSKLPEHKQDEPTRAEREIEARELLREARPGTSWER